METVFVAGSMTIKHLHRSFKDRLAKVVASDMRVVVGDADGADTSIQKTLAELGAMRVLVFCSGERPRNNVGGWPVEKVKTAAEPGTRAFFTAKDLEMSKVADYGLMMWDAKSTGTLSNVIELLKRGKKSVVFVNKAKSFSTVGDPDSIRYLVSIMSSGARMKAELKIKLSSKIASIANHQPGLALEQRSEAPGQ